MSKKISGIKKFTNMLYVGYVPRGVHNRMVYTEIISKMDKHMILLGGKVLKGDYPFKFTKHIVKIADASVFIGLYTMTNEHEEIVYQVLVPSNTCPISNIQ
ncbi:hypothetical protein K501DRAFT_279141 [Backusella circina FSU 941]|nr:hypothetical protein K501DRAFT_279141 [Backusella circina FSU 941]